MLAALITTAAAAAVESRQSAIPYPFRCYRPRPRLGERKQKRDFSLRVQIFLADCDRVFSEGEFEGDSSTNRVDQPRQLDPIRSRATIIAHRAVISLINRIARKYLNVISTIILPLIPHACFYSFLFPRRAGMTLSFGERDDEWRRRSSRALVRCSSQQLASRETSSTVTACTSADSS